MSYESEYIRKLKQETGYHELEDSPIDNMIEYKDSLEDLVASIDYTMLMNSGHPDAERYREENDLSTISAADVTGQLFHLGLGNVPTQENS